MEANQLRGANSIKELCTKIAVRCAALEHVIDDGQQRVSHSHQSSLAATTVHEVACVRLEVAVLFVAGGPSRPAPSFLWLPAQAACTRACRSQRLPLVVFPLRFLPALSLLPGEMPAQEARCASLGNGVISGPISAINTSATRRSTPGIASSFSRTGTWPP